MKNVMLALVLLALTGCFKPYVPPSMRNKPSKSSTSLSASKKDDSTTEADTARQAMERRALAVVELEGHPKGKAFLDAVVNCQDFYTHPCGFDVQKAQNQAPAAFHAALALKHPKRAEKYMAEAEALAEKAAVDRKEKEEKAQIADEKRRADEEAVSADLKACAADKTPCKTRCKADKTSSACVALAVYTITGDRDDRFDEAEALLLPPCNAGMQPACRARTKAAADRTQVLGASDQAWSNVTSIGDDIATRKAMHAFASTQLTGRRNAVATQRLGQHIQALTTESYCPAVKEFLKVSNRAELARRSKKHCSEEPPTATGLSGEEQALTQECTAAFATPCN